MQGETSPEMALNRLVCQVDRDVAGASAKVRVRELAAKMRRLVSAQSRASAPAQPPSS